MYTRPYMVIAIPVGLSLIGFIFNTYDVVSMFWIFQYFAVVFAPWLVGANLMYTAYVTKMPTNIEQITNWHTGAVVDSTSPPSDGFIPLARKSVHTVPVLNQQVVSAPRFDMERQFAKDLLVMRDYKPNDEAVDLTEKKWVRPNKFKTRQAFVMDVLDKWKHYEILGRKSKAKNAPHIVIDWRQVELIADGNHLPPPPK